MSQQTLQCWFTDGSCTLSPCEQRGLDLLVAQLFRWHQSSRSSSALFSMSGVSVSSSLIKGLWFPTGFSFTNVSKSFALMLLCSNMSVFTCVGMTTLVTRSKSTSLCLVKDFKTLHCYKQLIYTFHFGRKHRSRQGMVIDTTVCWSGSSHWSSFFCQTRKLRGNEEELGSGAWINRSDADADQSAWDFHETIDLFHGTHKKNRCTCGFLMTIQAPRRNSLYMSGSDSCRIILPDRGVSFPHN